MTSSNNVGVLAIEVYFPSIFVSQTDLEVSNGVSAGKYVKGLGQEAMAFTGDREDINSIALTVVQSLLEKYNIDVNEVGRLEVGTESLVDKSKSTKTVLMSLFGDNTDIEGATVVNACYGGTAALLNALLWVDSSSWDGRYAIVVAADIAVYADGPARPTGGCGAVALLIGRDATLVIDLRTRCTFATHVWDFFKPNMDSEYPEVNGALSQTCYLKALDSCYQSFLKKTKSIHNRSLCLASIDHFLFHSPYNKLVQKSFSRLYYQDIINGTLSPNGVEKWLQSSPESTYEDKDLDLLLRNLSQTMFNTKVAPSCELSKQIGNTYTASVYMNLADLISRQGDLLQGKTIVLFSYGSGALASMFEISVASRPLCAQQFSLSKMQKALSISTRLASRTCRTPEDLTEALRTRENSHGFSPYNPTYDIECLFPGTFYLSEITVAFERVYARVPVTAVRRIDGPLKRLSVDNSNSSNPSCTDATDDEGVTIDTPDEAPLSTVSSALERATISSPPRPLLSNGSPLQPSAPFNGYQPLKGIQRSQTVVWASGRQTVHVVVTGVSAAVPGSAHRPGVDSITRIISGESFIAPVPAAVRADMLNKNVVCLVKGDDGVQRRVPVLLESENIQLCGPLGKVDLSVYGISESIASTMDRAVQVAVAAGLEALKDAGIVSGEGDGMSGWVLPPSMQDTTGVVYATSFPALDTAIEEVTKYFRSVSLQNQQISHVISSLRMRLEAAYGPLSEQTEEALGSLAAMAADDKGKGQEPYEFDRKFLFRVLVLGNAQLAQIVQARGPNMQTNAACAGD